MLKSGGILVGFVRPMYAFGRPRELRSRGLIREEMRIKLKYGYKLSKMYQKYLGLYVNYLTCCR